MSKDQTPVTAIAEEGERRRRSDAERRRIVEETYAPGASVSVVARRHDVNANLVFKWRQRYGRRQAAPQAEFLPVAVETSTADVVPPAPKRRRARKPAAEGFIEIEFSDGHRVRVHGSADGRTVRSIIEALSR
ncbi:MAG: transposase [Nevskia sp.]|nr:transposase [Nevskia sp.]